MKNGHLITVIGLVALGLLLAGCPKKPPAVPTVVSAPDTTWIRATTLVTVVTTQPDGEDVVYLASRDGSGTTDTLEEAGSGDTTRVTLPAWDAIGTHTFKLAAAVADNRTLVSAWGEEHSIYVAPNEPPADLELIAPMRAAVDVPTAFTVRAQDPDGDSIQFWFNFGDGSSGWEDTMLPTPATLTVFHEFGSEDTVWVKAKARDKKRSECAPESSQVIVGSEGGVLWWSVPGGLEAGDSDPVSTSPVMLSLLEDTLIYSGGCDDYDFYSLKFEDGHRKSTGSPAQAEEGFFWHPAYLKLTSHIICGNEDGELYAFTADGLTKDWRYPNRNPESLDYAAWSGVALNGNKIYAAKDNDTLYWLEDAGTSGVRRGAYYLKLLNAEFSTPIIDNSGNVIFGTESCFVYKLDGSLTFLWRQQVQTSGEIHNLALDDNGTIFAGTDQGKVVALNPDGTTKWSKDVDPGRDAWYMVVGNNVLYVTTGTCKVVALNPSTGDELWNLPLGGEDLDAGPVLTTKYLYVLDNEDILYCIDVQSTPGVLLWTCNCPMQAGLQAPRSTRLTSPSNAALTIGPDGDIIVIGEDAAYRVAGYEDVLAPTRWPKWQRDLYNTGCYNSAP